MKTKILNIEDAGCVMCDSKQVIILDDDSQMLAIREDGFIIINSEKDGEADFAICATVKERGDDQTRLIYLAEADEVKVLESGIVASTDELYETVTEIIESKYPELAPTDSETLGLFPIQPTLGLQYASAGIELYRLAK